jgi:hypothetical protein
MGLFSRFANRSQERWWASVQLADGERPIDYAHMLLIFSDAADRPGTAFLTDERLIWFDNERGPVSFELADFKGYGPLTAEQRQPAIGFTAHKQGMDVDMSFIPGQSTTDL